MTHLVIAIVAKGNPAYPNGELVQQRVQATSAADAALTFVTGEERRGNIVTHYTVLAGSASVQIEPRAVQRVGDTWR